MFWFPGEFIALDTGNCSTVQINYAVFITNRFHALYPQLQHCVVLDEEKSHCEAMEDIPPKSRSYNYYEAMDVWILCMPKVLMLTLL